MNRFHRFASRNCAATTYSRNAPHMPRQPEAITAPATTASPATTGWARPAPKKSELAPPKDAGGRANLAVEGAKIHDKDHR
jgi:hypothetical protein